MLCREKPHYIPRVSKKPPKPDAKEMKHEKVAAKTLASKPAKSAAIPKARPSALLDTRVIYCGDNLEQLSKLPKASVDLIYIDPPFNSNRNYEVFWGETKEKRAFEDRHASYFVTLMFGLFSRPNSLISSSVSCSSRN